ncbi:MAG TPA: cation-translocating P-type ATPase [Oscillospiraceae bacterium]|nr:cation-translocating P-type ATPase [Oscillospiraceae bacterium]HPF55388.1 cation-translocating P-type ATPase [Clostridiales bacterium]HPK35600.1 cation-translocating P-type ATPase [Oscillospiraceae bacterium]HPR74664.1 cation-translocating P-type ATPase [Oscillospiraceae bacterium]
MSYYRQTKENVLQSLKSSVSGLSAPEAEQRQLSYGKNKLAEPKKTSLFTRFFKQLANPMIIVLLIAAALSGFTAAYEGESMADVFIILFVVILNSILGIVQESKAEEAIEALKTMTASTSKVLRDGKLAIIKSEDLVPGDIIHLEAGDSVPADARILECASMKVEEAALTGESVPAEKTADVLEGDREISLGDRRNMVYMGSTVVYGRGVAVVCDTGMKTEMGKIADALTQAKEEATPLQVKLAGLSKILTWIVLGICIVIFGAGVLKAGAFSTEVVISTFMLAVSLAVAAIPEGLAAVVTIVLSIGVTKMAKRNAVIRRLTAVETLGCTQVICSDKTGTLTQNKMTVVKAESADDLKLAAAMCLCTDAEFDEQAQTAVGEPTECALVNYAYTRSLNKNELKKTAPRIGEAPFDSMRKMMTTVHSAQNGFIQYTKGAPDEILKRCTHILTEDGVVSLTDALKENIRRANKAMADNALRVLAGAYKDLSQKPGNFAPETLENDLIFLGLCGMIDPIRSEVKAAVDKCRDAGVSVVMITGDHIDTAIAIAKDLGILTDSSQAILGQALDGMSDEELDRQIENYHVYARVQPEHKVRIVNAWKRRGRITAMTGDGVNDAPSIKSADIGIGMGITGTDVTKNVADMILADDNFATIVAAVEEGRRIYANIRRAIQFLLSSNLSEVLGIFIATMLGFTLLKPIHILWINLITDSLPALALGMEHGEADTMRQKPRDAKAGIFSGGVGRDTIYQGALVAILLLAAYFIGHRIESGVWEIANSPDGMTMAFLTMSMAEIFHSFNMRSRRGSIFTIKRQNIWLWSAAIGALLLTTAVIYIPFLSVTFGFAPISLAEYAIALALAFAIIPLVELVKFVQRQIKSLKKSS